MSKLYNIPPIPLWEGQRDPKILAEVELDDKIWMEGTRAPCWGSRQPRGAIRGG